MKKNICFMVLILVLSIFAYAQDGESQTTTSDKDYTQGNVVVPGLGGVSTAYYGLLKVKKKSTTSNGAFTDNMILS